MTDEEAMAEAMRRWGNSGYARRHMSPHGADEDAYWLIADGCPVVHGLPV